MGDSSSFTSLMAMVESHLSKTSLQVSQNSDGVAGPSFSLPSICSQKGMSDTLLPPPDKIIPLPRFEVKNSEITELLAQQVKNMLIAKENKKKEEEEKQRLAIQMKQLNLQEHDDDYVIDLTASIMRPGQSGVGLPKQEVLSSSSSFESLFSEINEKYDNNKAKERVELMVIESLPVKQDLSYILFQKIKKGRCSAFGKVLTSRLRPVAAPYLMSQIHNPAIVPFDFSTKSPCDINKERRLHPPADPYAHLNAVDRFMAMTRDEA